jgi:hypothetical protein
MGKVRAQGRSPQNIQRVVLPQIHPGKADEERPKGRGGADVVPGRIKPDHEVRHGKGQSGVVGGERGRARKELVVEAAADEFRA